MNETWLANTRFEVLLRTEMQHPEENLFCKLLPAKRGEDFPIRQDFLDLTIVCYYSCEGDGEGEILPVDGELLAYLGISGDRAFTIAMENTRKRFGERLSTLTDMICELAGGLPGNIDPDEVEIPMYVLTNLQCRYGALCLLYSNLPDMLAEKLESDLYIIPSSVHEVLLVPVKEGITGERLNQMVREVNETELEYYDVLSDHVYYFSAKTGCISIAEA